MSYKYLKNHLTDIFIFLSLALIVSWLQIVLLEPHLHYGFTPDDWWPLKNYKYLDGNFFSNILEIWKQSGAYLTYQVLFIGIMHNFLGFHSEAYQITNHILKALSALAVYPLVYIVFRSRLLAFITTILYAMAYSPVGTLEIVVRGSDFIAIVFLCFFLIAYYKTIAKGLNGVKWLTILTILLILPMFLSPIRIYPILFFIVIIEFYLVISKRSKQVLLSSFKRIFFLLFPYLLVTILPPSSVISFTGNAPAIISRILIGNWQLLLYPLGSFGSLFLINDYWRIFGSVQTKSFIDYIGYIMVNPLIIFGLIALFYSIILSIPSKRFLRFFFKVISINFLLQLVVFVLAKHSESIDSSIRMGYDYVELYPVFFATFILVLSFSIWHEWINTGKKNNLLLALWIGSAFSFIFIFWTWLFKDWSVLFKGVHTYLNIPSIGISLFTGSTLILLYLKIKNSLGALGKYIALFTFLLLIPIFNINKSTIFHIWNLNNYSMDAKEHEDMRNRLWNSLPQFNTKRPSLFYFDTSGDYKNGRFYEMSMLGRFSDWMYFKGNYSPGSCAVPLFIINNIDQLKSMIIVKDGEKGFNYHDYCWKAYFYHLQNFYAFKLNDRKPIDIKNETLDKLGVVQN